MDIIHRSTKLTHNTFIHGCHSTHLTVRFDNKNGRQIIALDAGQTIVCYCASSFLFV